MWRWLRDLLWPATLPDRLTLGRIGLPVLIAVALLLLDRYGIQRAWYQYFSDWSLYAGFSGGRETFAAQLHLTLSNLVLFVLLPLAYHLAFPADGGGRYGLSMAGAVTHFPVYALMLALMLPVLWLASADPGFHRFYPMYKPQDIGDWLRYEAVYLVQFFAVEFFFRGFCLFRMERFAGYYAIPIMVIPYALIHIHKPLPEALASIAGGLVLGYLALRTRSIWPGIFVHCGIAFCMDWFSLIRAGWFGAL